MSIPFWDPVTSTADGPPGLAPEDPWDVCILAGFVLPGLCTVKGAPTLSFDKKKGGGVDGATITVNGYLPGPIEIELLMWTDGQWQDFQNFVAPKIWRKPNKKSKASELAVDVSHPAFDLWGISQVVILGVSLPENGPSVGTKVVKFKCVEFVPQEAKSQTKTAKSGVIVPIAKEYDPAKNRAGDAPDKTDIQFTGPPQSKKGGVS